MEHEAVDLLYERERVRGVLVQTPAGKEQIAADLVVACDGRHSLMRAAGELQVRELGVPIDVLWFRISRQGEDGEQVLGHINFGKMLILINRNDYFQAGLIIPKNSFEQLKRKGLESFRKDISRIAPFLSGRVAELQNWEEVKLLSVQINRLTRWHRPGLLCIGDAAHAMSPVFGVGINLAIQDAVAAANILMRPLHAERNTDDLLASVQQQREFRTRIIQRLQAIAHAGFQYVFRRPGPLHASWLFKLVTRTHVLQPVLLRVVGVGIIAEHVSTPSIPARRTASRIARLVAIGAGVAAMVTVASRSLKGKPDHAVKSLEPST